MLPCCEFQGRISRGFRFWRRECTGEASEELLKADGIEVVNGRVDLKKYGI